MKLLDLAKASAVNLYAHLPLAARRQEMTGYIFGLMAGFFYGAWNVIAKTTINDYQIPPILFATVAFCFGVLMFAPFLVMGVPKALVNSGFSLAMFALSGIASGSAIIALSFSLEKADVTVVAPVVSVSPLITLVIVRVFMERLEKVTWTLLIGVLLVVGGTVMVVVGDTVL